MTHPTEPTPEPKPESAPAAGARQSAAQLINQSSGDVEIYTPSNIIEAARRTLGAIDLDPASSEAANVSIRAARFFTAPPFQITGSIYGFPVRTYDHNGGLDLQWEGRVWMNHPFGRRQRKCPPNCYSAACQKRGFHLGATLKGNEDWVAKAEQETMMARVSALCMICFASTSEKWFRPLLRYPQCFLSPRTNYLRPDGTIYRGVTKGSVVTYMGPRIERFAESFRPLGEIKVSYP